MRERMKNANLILNQSYFPKLPPEFLLLKEEVAKKYPNTRSIGNIIRKNPEIYYEFLKHAKRMMKEGEVKENADVNSIINAIGLESIADAFMSAFLTKSLSLVPIDRQILADGVNTAIVASVLSEDLFDVSRSDVYLAGLLHNIGYIFLCGNNNEFEEYYSKSVLSPINNYNKESITFSTTGKHASMALASKWGIDKSIIKALALLYVEFDLNSSSEESKKIMRITRVIEAAKYLTVYSLDENYVNEDLMTLGKNAINDLGITGRCYTKSIAMLNKFGVKEKDFRVK